MITSPTRPHAAVSLALAGSLLLHTADAQAITVGPVGSGAMYSSIQAAIDAAPPGGVVLVAPGIYSEQTTLTINKALTLLGAGSSATTYQAETTPGFVFRIPLRVIALAAGAQVTVAGFQLIAVPGASTVSHARMGFEVVDCAGSVVLSDLVLGSVWPGFSGGLHTTACAVSNAAIVTLDRCRLDASTQVMAFGAPTALRVFRSLVHVNACSLFGSPAQFYSGLPWNGAPAIEATESTLRIARSDIRGGDGLQLSFPGSAGGAAVLADAQSIVSTTADVVMIAGLGGNGQPSTPPIAGGGLQAPLPVPLPTVAVAAPLVTPGGVLALGINGEPFAVSLTLLALGTTPGYARPGVLGLFTLDPSGIAVLSVELLDANGAAATQLSVPPAPTLTGTVVHAQSLSFAPSGLIAVSGPTVAAVR